MKKGNIQVNTENIFPIIKKFLYSEHEIFIRELVSNAVDACQKLKTLAQIGEYKKELGDLRIDVRINTSDNTITVSDSGIGMSAEEVEKYINQLAFSGAEEFVSKYKDKLSSNIIGHFGLGFYSAFMVAEKVVIESQSMDLTAKAIRWECDGSPNYTLSNSKRATRGTDIILHINEDSKNFLEAETLKQALLKFCRFLPIPIFFEDKQINDVEPLWVHKAADLEDKAYIDFYTKLFPLSETPLFWIHLNVDYPFNLSGILYFPKINQSSYEIRKDKISLYANQVYVTDEVKDVVPEFLMLLHGVIDSPDIPLNVSRSHLQGDPNVKKISQYITKKVLDKLEELFKKDRDNYVKHWGSLQLFVKFGMMTDQKFQERAKDYLLFLDVDGKYKTLSELRSELSENQTDKDGNFILIYSSDKDGQDMAIKRAKALNYQVLLLNSPIDNHFINHLEYKEEKLRFKQVDAEVASELIKKSDSQDLVSSLNEQEQQNLKDKLTQITASQKPELEFKALTPETSPLTVVQDEWARRMQEFTKLSQGENNKAELSMLKLIVNTNHPIFAKLLKRDDLEAKLQQLYDLALLTHGCLRGKELSNFVERNLDGLLNS